MGRYIDVDEAHAEIEKMQNELETNDDKLWRKNKPYYKGMAYARGALNDIPTADVVEITEDFESILVCAERYACGRQTYMPSLVIDYITPLLPRLGTRTLAVFERDIAGANGYGDEKIDKPCWMRFLSDVRAELERRKQ